MLKVSSASCFCLQLLCLYQYLGPVDGLIEIVEEQQCHDYHFRLTCRELNAHIAILEAWYTSIEHYQENSNITRSELPKIKTENDSERDKVYIYSSPKHNGVYNSANRSFEFKNISSVDLFEHDNSVKVPSDRINAVNVKNSCGVVSFSKSYGSWRDGDKRRRSLEREYSLNLRAPLSYRCTGVNHCSFVLNEDYPPAARWGPGVMYIKYACFDDSLTIHYCNREVQIGPSGPDSEGYIRTPGYPHFYVGDKCRWRLRANQEQRIRLTFMDVSLRSTGPFESECTDYVSVKDSNGDVLLSSCEQVELPLRITSTTSSLEILVKVHSKGAYPKRGVLFHYKSIDCVTVPAPSSGYLVYRNEDVAHYMCNVNHVFVDTRQRARMLWCYDDNSWNDTVPLCVEESSLIAIGDDFIAPSPDKDAKLPHNEANMIVDIVIPSLLIAALFIGNAFIVLIIYKYRKRKCDDLEDEFNTIPLSANGNSHTTGNAV